MTTVNFSRAESMMMRSAKIAPCAHKGHTLLTLFLLLLTTASSWAWTGSGTSESPYLIASASDLAQLATNVNNGTGDDYAASGYKDKYFKQTANITLSGNWTPIGIDGKPFKGHYNGGGYTITGLKVTGDYRYAGLFGLIASGDYVGSMACYRQAELKDINIVDCNISVGGFNSSKAGGIAGQASTIDMSGCHVSGTITGFGYACGLIGYIDQTSGVKVTNSFVDVTVTGTGNQYITPQVHLMACVSGGAPTASGNYCHDNIGNVSTGISATPLYMVKDAPSGMTVAETNATLTYNDKCYFTPGETATLTVDANKIIKTFSVSGATSSSVAANKKSATVTLASSDATVTATLLTIGGTCGSNATWAMTDSNSDGTYETLTISGSGAITSSPWTTDFTATIQRVKISSSDLTISGNLFSTLGSNAVIVVPTPAYAVNYSSATYASKLRVALGDYLFTVTNEGGSAACQIANEDDLNRLAMAVNAGWNASGLTFRQTAPITYTHKAANAAGADTENNYTAIGGYHSGTHYFKGNFDGQNYVISGIRIYKGGSSDGDKYQGLFGYINGGEVKNVILADASITGTSSTGGIVGYNYKGTVTGCHVLSDVNINAVQNNIEKHGGIVGEIFDGTVIGCTSAASITAANYNINYGGVVGGNISGTVRDCLYFGTTLQGWKNVGAIVGYNSHTVSNCYFTSTAIIGKDNNCDDLSNAASAVGSGGNVATTVGLTRTVSAGSGVTISNIAPTGSTTQYGNNNGITAYSGGGLSYGGNLYYGKGCVLSLTLSNNNDSAPLGYHYISNYTASSGTLTGAQNPYSLTMLDANVTITAELTNNTYTVQFDGNGSTGGSMTDQAFTYDEEQNLTANAFTRTGYTFAGWTTSTDGDVAYTDEENVSNLIATNDGTVTLYAKWTAITYTITYNLNGGSMATPNPSTYDIETASITLNNPTKLGDTFFGWYNNNELTGDAVTTIPQGSTGNVVLWAKWGTPYIDADGNTQYCYSATLLTNETNVRDLSAGWYVVYGNVNYSRFHCYSGDTHLILGDGAKMTVETDNGNDAVIFAAGLTIYAQSTGSSMGRLEAISNMGNGIEGTGNLTIWGGHITAKGYNGYGYSGIHSVHDITIHGGQVNATGDMGIRAEDNITLCLRNATDYIIASSYLGRSKVCIAEGYTLYDESGNAYSGTLGSSENNAIASKMLMSDKDAHSTFPFFITYHLNGGELTTEKNSYTVASDDITLDEPTHPYYTFLGWYDNEKLMGEAVTTIAHGSKGDKTFWAKWEWTGLTISSEADWNQFASSVNNGIICSGLTLAADIYVSTMAGTSQHPFKGTFDGGGHTINFNVNTSEEFCAPFRYASGATFQNLKVNGTITTSKKFAAGFVGQVVSGGNGCTFTNCESQINIVSSKNGDGTHGGFVADMGAASNYFTGCVFSGSITTTNGTNACGGFVGWNNGSVKYTNCLQKGTFNLNYTDNCATFNRGKAPDATSSNYYYLTAFGEKQGTKVYVTSPSDAQTITVTAADGNTYYIVTGILININTDNEWETFANSVNTGENLYSDTIITLTDDISTSTMVGTSQHPFKGTFDGGGKTLTVSYANTDDNTMTAPFSYVDGATIRNLIVGGSITGSTSRAAGIIGETSDNLSHITNCVSSVNISGGRYIGGFSIGGNVAIEGCVFNGKIVGTEYSGGFVGWSYSGLTITNCLFAPQDGSSISGGTFYYNGGGGNITPTNSYYTTALGTPQGAMARSSATQPAKIGTAGTAYSVSGITPYTSGLFYDGLYYMTPEAISLANASSNDVDGINGDFADVTLSDRKLFIDGNWNTLCLPFDIDDLDGTLLAHVTIMELDGTASNLTDGTLTLNFKDANRIEAGKPYILEYNSNSNANRYTPDGNYIIRSKADWDAFADLVNGGQTSLNAVLDADITEAVTKMVGNSSYNYAGTFNGYGHTLMVNLNNDDETGTDDANYGVAPFRFTSGATIKNLTVEGTITTSTRKFAAGMIGKTVSGTNRIQNCISSVEIASSINGDGTHGGFVGKACGTLNISNCLFNGAMTTSQSNGTHSCGGFVGWKDNSSSLEISNSLYAPILPDGKYRIGNNNGATFARNGGTFHYCYYTETLGSVQGTDGSSMSATDLVADAALGSENWEVSGSAAVPKPTTTILAIIDPQFWGVNIKATMNDVTTSDDKVTFKGTYDYIPFDNTDRSVLFLGDEDKLYYPENGASIGAFRAYFKITDGSPVRAFRLNFGEEESQGIKSIDNLRFDTGAWYTLDGVKLDKVPTRKGLYIHNGHKVAIK